MDCKGVVSDWEGYKSDCRASEWVWVGWGMKREGWDKGGVGGVSAVLTNKVDWEEMGICWPAFFGKGCRMWRVEWRGGCGG